jgi:hypothetical protein
MNLKCSTYRCLLHTYVICILFIALGVRADETSEVTTKTIDKQNYHKHIFEEGAYIPIYSLYVHPLRNPSETYTLKKVLSWWFPNTSSSNLEQETYGGSIFSNSALVKLFQSLRKTTLSESLLGERIILTPYTLQYKSKHACLMKLHKI